METNLDYNHLSQSHNLLKVEDVATILNVSRSFAYKLLQIGEIRVVRLGKACRVRPHDLQAYIDNNLNSQ